MENDADSVGKKRNLEPVKHIYRLRCLLPREAYDQFFKSLTIPGNTSSNPKSYIDAPGII